MVFYVVVTSAARSVRKDAELIEQSVKQKEIAHRRKVAHRQACITYQHFGEHQLIVQLFETPQEGTVSIRTHTTRR